MKKSRAYIKMADLVLFMLDAGKCWSSADSRILKNIKGKEKIVVVNKIDMRKKLDIGRVKRLTGEKEVVEISILKKKNLDRLEKAILDKICKGRLPQPEGAFITNLRQRKELARASEKIKECIDVIGERKDRAWELAAPLVREAEFHLGSIMGDSVEPDILGRIFEKFCVGK